MAHHLTVATIMETHRVSSDVAFIIMLEIGILNQVGTLIETVRICKNDENLTFEGNEYIASNFDIDYKQKSGEDTTLKLSVEDVTGILRQRMEELDGGVGFPVRMIILNTEKMDDAAEIDENFTVLSGAAKGYQVSFDLGAENLLHLQFPRRRQYSDRCTFDYKGPRCKYAGALGTCDYTYNGANGCVAHGNEENFGGCRGLKPLGF